MPSTSVVPI